MVGELPMKDVLLALAVVIGIFTLGCLGVFITWRMSRDNYSGNGPWVRFRAMLGRWKKRKAPGSGT